MLPYRLLQTSQPALPPHCEPTDAFLTALSATFHTCIPSYLALLSTLLGTLSIVSWLFAQLPQIYKNYRLKSTSGLSVYFLTEWLLGDLTNLLGCLFTRQATWQIVVASYYVLVDCGLTGQWIWYELLHHGRPLRPIWGRWRSGASDGGDGGMQQVAAQPDAADTKVDDVPRSSPRDAFRIPNFARSNAAVSESYAVSPMGGPRISNTPGTGTPPSRTVRTNGSPPVGSPKALLYTTLLFALLSHTLAHPTPSSLETPSSPPSPSTTETLGTIFSWSSTALYLLSRLPQLYKNHSRRSTAGLSPSLFLAAFFGNLFYSSSLLTNPCAWSDFPANSGWSEDGTDKAEWRARALPFFLGAAGVLGMDFCVGVQFFLFGERADERGRKQGREDEVLVTVDEHGVPRRRKLHWRRVSGWMRGWAPAVSVAGTPSVSRASSLAGESEDADADVGGRSKSQSVPIAGALDEARALLGTGRHASPRSYGALGGSPR